MVFEYSEDKRQELISEGKMDFALIIEMIEQGNILDIKQNEVKGREHQKVFILEYHDYIRIVPFVETPEKIFLKTNYPSRKQTKIYL